MEKEIWIVTYKNKVVGYTFSERACLNYIVKGDKSTLKYLDCYKIENLEK